MAPGAMLCGDRTFSRFPFSALGSWDNILRFRYKAESAVKVDSCPSVRLYGDDTGGGGGGEKIKEPRHRLQKCTQITFRWRPLA